MSSFLSKVRDNSSRASSSGKEDALLHVRSIRGEDESFAEALYSKAKEALGDLRIVVNAVPKDVEAFLKGSPLRNTDSAEFAQARRALGIEETPLVGLLTSKPEGNRSAGEWSLVLSDVGDEAVLLSGDMGRVRNPTRGDFKPDPSDVLYSWEQATSCKASASIMALGSHELSGSIEEAIARLTDEDVDYGPCHVLLMGSVTPEKVSKLVVPDMEALREARSILDGVGRLLPVHVSTRTVRLRAPEWQHEEEDTPPRRNPSPLYLSEGDSVVLKPLASNGNASGVVTGVSGGKVTVEWQNGQRVAYDLFEALARLMPAPRSIPPVLGDVSYSLPGMTRKAFSILSALDIDPVDIYSVASTYTVPCEEVPVDEDRMTGVMRSMGIHGKFVDGFVPGEHNVAFVPHRWYEASLPYGNRLVIDLSSPRPKVVAGDAQDYLILPEFTQVPAE